MRTKVQFRHENEVAAGLLRAARLAADLSQAEVAAACQRPQTWCSAVELGERRLTLVETVDWLRVCGADFVDFAQKYTKTVAGMPSSKQGKVGAGAARGYLESKAKSVISKLQKKPG